MKAVNKDLLGGRVGSGMGVEVEGGQRLSWQLLWGYEVVDWLCRLEPTVTNDVIITDTDTIITNYNYG